MEILCTARKTHAAMTGCSALNDAWKVGLPREHVGKRAHQTHSRGLEDRCLLRLTLPSRTRVIHGGSSSCGLHGKSMYVPVP